MLRVFSSVVPKEPWGGSHQFTRHLINYLRQEGVGVTFDPDDRFDLLYLNSWLLPLEQAAAIKAKGVKVVHRIDGIGHVYGRDTDRHDRLQLALNELADLTVYQSYFCRQLCLDNGFKSTDDNSAVIYNGTDQSIFHPPAVGGWIRRGGEIRLLACSWSKNLNKGFERMAELSLTHDLTFVGQWNEAVPTANVKVVSAVTQPELAAIMRDSDVFVHLSKLEACPNVAIEAMSCGLPVLYDDSGANREVVGDGGLPFADASIEAVAEDLEAWQARALRRSRQFSINKTGRAYLAAFRKVLGEERTE